MSNPMVSLSSFLKGGYARLERDTDIVRRHADGSVERLFTVIPVPATAHPDPEVAPPGDDRVVSPDAPAPSRSGTGADEPDGQSQVSGSPSAPAAGRVARPGVRPAGRPGLQATLDRAAKAGRG